MIRSGFVSLGKVGLALLIFLSFALSSGCATRGSSLAEKAADAVDVVDISINRAEDPESVSERVHSALKNSTIDLVKCTPFNRLRGECD